MDLTWWWVVVIACVALAAVVVAALAQRGDTEREMRPLANLDRLTRLPAYVRAARRRTLMTVATLLLLSVALVGAVVAAARPTGLPGPARDTRTAQPEDVMVCAGAPAAEAPMAAALRYFAARVPGYDTQRIGLTTPDRRVIPMTRDHQYAATAFAEFERAADTGAAPAVSYSDYAPTVEDLIALCITGFPSFDRIEAQRRSVVYVGPARLPGAAADSRPLFDVAALRAAAEAAGVQVNAVMTNGDSDLLQELADDTGGGYIAPNGGVDASLERIRSNPPPPTSADGPTTQSTTSETPELPVFLALVALAGVGVARAPWYRQRRTDGGRNTRWRAAGLVLATALLVIAAVRPVIGESSRTLPAGAADGEPNVFLVIDRSPGAPPAVRDDITGVLDRYPNARIAVISFAATPTLERPLSQDIWGLRPVLAALRPYAATPETVDRANVAAASNLLRYQLISARQQFPRAANLVFYYGAGVSGRASPPREFALAEGSVDGGAVFDYATTAAERESLRSVAGQIGVPLVVGGDRLDGAEVPTADATPPTSATEATETYWLAAAAAAALILVELFVVLRDLARSRSGRLREPT